MASTKRGSPCWRGLLLKDNKLICDIQSYAIPFDLPPQLVIEKFETDTICPLNVLPVFDVYPLGANPARLEEWKRFINFLKTYRKVAYVTIEGWELLISPNVEVNIKQGVTVSYRLQRNSISTNSCAPIKPVANILGASGGQTVAVSAFSPTPAPITIKASKKCSSFARTHPSYLETLGQIHASWIFGGLAELVDNARDAKANRLDISIDQEFLKATKGQIPVLSVRDNGIGMTHSEILRMISFGHKKPDEDDESIIGRFGVGFKTGTMRLGKDVVVLTQSAETRSIAFLSQTYNQGKEEVEIPVITYRKEGGWMEFDLEVHSQEEAESRLMAVKQYSPFNEYNIGSRFAAFGEQTGTIVCVYNLDHWGSNYSLEWDEKETDAQQRHKRDIWIRSRRVRARPSQMTKSVPLDYSLHSYLEVMFLEPKMKIYIQGTMVKTRRLHKSLNKTQVFKGIVAGKKVELTLGRSQAEKDAGNCGMFLYWHGRLIEAYKRVGAMLHTADVGRGVIGVIDVTDILRSEDGVGVLNNKQGFQDCVTFTELEDWLATMADRYWDDNYDRLEVVGKKDENAVYTPDHSWVQCNRCLKWRILYAVIEDKDLPNEWFCYMPPYKGSCMDPECEAEAGVVTLGASRTYGDAAPRSVKKEDVQHSATNSDSTLSTKELSDASDDNMNSKMVNRPVLKRLKRGPAMSSKSWKSSAKKICNKSG